MVEEQGRQLPAAQVVEPGALGEIVRGEIDMQIATAKRWPRSISKFLVDARTLACIDPQTALSCWYTLPRGGKKIEGPSVRLAEIVASAWGNLRYGARIVGEDYNYVTAQGFAHDLERNQAVTFEVRRRIVNKQGTRYNDDMIGVTGSAASAIALRNAIFKVVPRSLVDAILRECRKTAAGDVKSVAESRQEAISYFVGKGITEDRIFAALGKKAIEDLGLEEVIDLRNIAKSVKDGEIILADAFPVVAQVSKADSLANKIEGQADKPASATPEPDKLAEPAAPPAEEPKPAEPEPAPAPATADKKEPWPTAPIGKKKRAESI
jgi:hypothetical protein